MSEIPNIHVKRSFIIVRRDDLYEIKDFCGKYGFDLFVREVVLIPSDADVLRR